MAGGVRGVSGFYGMLDDLKAAVTEGFRTWAIKIDICAYLTHSMR